VPYLRRAGITVSTTPSLNPFAFVFELLALDTPTSATSPTSGADDDWRSCSTGGYGHTRPHPLARKAIAAGARHSRPTSRV